MTLKLLQLHPARRREVHRRLLVIWDNGKENGNYYSTLGLYRDNRRENGG